jgi:hypothetical protein
MGQREQLSFSLRGITRHENWVVYTRRALLFLSIVLEDLLELFAHAFEIFKGGGSSLLHDISFRVLAWFRR